MDKVYKTLTVKQDEDGWWVASTPSVDRDGDVVEPLGLDLTNWQKAGAPLLWGHDYRSHWSTIGKAAESRLSDSGFELKPEWRDPVNESDPMTVIKGLIDQGLIRQLSIGFKPIEFEEIDTGIRFSKSEIMEVSAVNVAANQDALRLAVKGLGPDDELEERVAEIERQLNDDEPEAAEDELEQLEQPEQSDEPEPEVDGTGEDETQNEEGGEHDVNRLSDAEEPRTEPDSGTAARDTDADPVTDDDTEPEIDEDAIAEALTPFVEALTGELIHE